MDRSRYRSLFVVEARRTLADAAAALERQDVRALLRAFHTLKGMSATMGLGPMVALAHALEDVCEAAATGVVALDPARPLVTEALERLEQQVAAVEAGDEPVDDDALVEAVRGHLVAAARTGFRLLGTEPASADPLHEDTADEPTVDGAGDTLARVLSAVGRLRARVADAEAQAELTRIADGVRQLHAELTALREVPFATVVPPLRRRLRDVCAAVGREARLDVDGEGVRLHPAVLGPLQAALVHLLHNAIIHGIEPDRGEKPPVGRVHLTVAHAGRDVVVELRDDGRGLDEAGLRGAAGEPGADPVALALRPGVSTLGAAGPVAGRGEGLPAAAALVERLGGGLEVRSTPGRGTCVRIRVPPAPSAAPATPPPDGAMLPPLPGESS